MKNMLFAIIAMFALSGLTGCSVKPFSPENKQHIRNNGEIDEIKSNQNGIMLDLLKIKNEQTMNARDIKDMQNGNFNKSNSGIQVLQGDGVLLAGVLIVGLGMILIYHYRTEALKFQKSAQIMAQQVAEHADEGLEDKIFMAALNTDVEAEVYHLITKNQK